MNNKNNNFKLLCIGVIAFSAVAIIIFVSLGGGEGVVVQEQKDGFNDILPDAKVETISDDRLMAARKEDARRKKEQMQGITGSSFQLLEIQENEDDKVNQAKVDSLFNDEELTSAQKNIHSKINDGNYASDHKLENDEVADNESQGNEDADEYYFKVLQDADNPRITFNIDFNEDSAQIFPGTKLKGWVIDDDCVKDSGLKYILSTSIKIERKSVS